jgi:hypothetical protein
LSTDKKGTRILARTFFNQLRASGYTPHQIIGVATELLDLVTEELKAPAPAAEAHVVSQATLAQKPDFRPEL